MKHTAELNYLSQSIESSLYRNGKVYTHRDKDGNDDIHHGVEWNQQLVSINDARKLDHTDYRQLDSYGFELINHPLQNFDFLDNKQVVLKYYPVCTEIVRQATTATQVFAFDHNVRWPKEYDDKKRIANASQKVQTPIHYVHGDYTLTSAPQRLKDLANSPSINDTLLPFLGKGESLLSKDIVARVFNEGKRFALINVWRNIDCVPIKRDPLAVCNGQSVLPKDLVVFEIRYQDRIGENYFAKYSANHDWWYYPSMTRNEVLLIKQWDSKGKFAQSSSDQIDSSEDEINNQICTFCLHSAIRDPDSTANAPQRKSIEVRCIAIF